MSNAMYDKWEADLIKEKDDLLVKIANPNYSDPHWSEHVIVRKERVMAIEAELKHVERERKEVLKFNHSDTLYRCATCNTINKGDALDPVEGDNHDDVYLKTYFEECTNCRTLTKQHFLK